MKKKLIVYLAFSFIFLSACMLLPLPGSATKSPNLPDANPNPLVTSTPEEQAPVGEAIEPTADIPPTELPPTAVTTMTTAPQKQPVNLQLVVFGADEALHLVSTTLSLPAGSHPYLTGFLPSGGAANGTGYVLSFQNGASPAAIHDGGTQPLDFIQNPNYGLAVWPGDAKSQPWLAWGTIPVDMTTPSTLQVSRADGSQLETLVTNDTGPERPTQLVAEFWSADGQSLYYSKEPYGIGGAIAFSGASSLYNVNIISKKITEIIPLGGDGSPMLCLDAISTDVRFVADHCTLGKITIRDLTGATAALVILPPPDAKGYVIVGGARFSPGAKKVAFGMTSGDMTNMKGWLAVSDGTGATSKLILSTPTGQYYTISGWLNDNTLLVESHDILCNPTCNNAVYTIGTDGSNLTKIADGSLQAVVESQ